MDNAPILISQYLASLEMLRQTIVACPEDMWNAPDDRNKFWQTAFHALYFTHEYLWENTENYELRITNYELGMTNDELGITN